MDGLEAQTSSTETSTASSTPAVDSTPASSATPAANASAAPASGTPAEQTPAWTPDFKFKAAGAEHEIPELYRGLVKDQKTLEEVKRLHEKAYGLDAIAQSRDALKRQIAEEFSPKLKEYENVSKNFNKLSYFVQNKDFDSFFQGLNIPEKDIVEWIQRKIELAQATPEVRQQYEQARQLRQQQYELQQQNQMYEAQMLEFQQAQAFYTVEQTVSQLAASHAQAYDARMGEGAFLQQVIDRGIAITTSTGQEPPVEAVVQQLVGELEKLGVIQNSQPAPAGQQAQMQGAPQGSPAKQKPSLPVIPAGGQSPISSPVKSMDDLKKRAASMGINL